MKSSYGFIEDWFESNNWRVFAFQRKAWLSILEGKSGLINAPTGSGKTYSALLGHLAKARTNGDSNFSGLYLIWVTPIKALAKEIKISCERAILALEFDWEVGVRTGDTSQKERTNQLKRPPQILITTPESIHVLLTQKNHNKFFKRIQGIVIDEWHELLGSKRGVQTELLLAYFRYMNPKVLIWGISATIGNLEEALQVLLGPNHFGGVIIKSRIKKKIHIESVIPENVETYPWSGHIGLKMLPRIIPIINSSKSTLIFTNTRAQCEIWYQQLLAYEEEFAGQIAMHHGSISKEVRDWVEDQLYIGKLKAVVCTSSLDLGVDFRPVESIIQIGSPKSVARLMQRAGRSGHRPGAKSRIYFVPTHSIELLEAAAIRNAVKVGMIEHRLFYIRCFDVLIQFLLTLAVGNGFRSKEVRSIVCDTRCYSSLNIEEWSEVINHLVVGSPSLMAYDEYQKVVVDDGLYKVVNRGIAMRHRMSIGTIVSGGMIQVKYSKGKKLGVVEEWFVGQLMTGDVFWFAGRALEVVRIREMTLYVKDAKNKKGRIPSYLGGRLQLSSSISHQMRFLLDDYLKGIIEAKEIASLVALFDVQRNDSIIPRSDELLVEYFETEEGYHLLFYPFEGRYVHEGLAALFAKRISKKIPISFSIAMNDYGFELLSDQKVSIENIIKEDLFSTKGLFEDILSTVNATEMSMRKFRDIAIISGLIFSGYPGKHKKNKHLQSSSQLLYKVFESYEPDNLLFRQAIEETMTFQLEEDRLRKALNRISAQKIRIQFPPKPTPLSFPILVDGLREKLSSEKLLNRILKWQNKA